nr:hypothetical protein [Myxococcus sp. RHSTA-1-4]
MGGVVGEVRAKLGLAREKAPARNEVVRHAPPPRPPPEPAKTVVERTPRPRPLAGSEPASEPVAALEPRVEAVAPPAESPAPKAAASKRAKVKKARAAKGGKAAARDATEAAPSKKARKSTSKARPKPKKAARASGEAVSQDASEAVSRLVEALRAHPRHEALVSAGKQKDQLVRSLIPLYLARAVDTDLEVTSGTTSRFWGELGVTYAAPNAAKALRLHSGYAQDTKKGKAITARGIQYVEEALERLREPASR